MTPDEYCQNKAARSGSSFYYSFMFLPPEQRRAITALYALCRELDDVVDDYSDPAIARTKLAWWRDEIARLFSEHQPEHPVTQALQQPVHRFGLPAEDMDALLAGMRMDLEGYTYQDFEELTVYCHRVAGVVGLMSARIFGYQDSRTLDYARELGLAFQLTNILRDVREDARRGRVYLPAQALQDHGLSPDDLAGDRTPPPLKTLLARGAERARYHYDQAFRWLPDVDRYPQRSGLIMAEIYLTLLQELERDGFRVLEHRVELTPIRKLWIAWRTARREQRHHRRRLRAAGGLSS